MSQTIFSGYSLVDIQQRLRDKLSIELLDAITGAVAFLEIVYGKNQKISHFRYLFANRMITEIFGENLVGKNFYLHDDVLLYTSMLNAISSGRHSEFVHYYDSPEKWLYYKIDLIDGGVLITFSDITPEKRAQLTIQKQELQKENAEKIANMGTFDWDLISNEITCSDQLLRIFGNESANGPMTCKNSCLSFFLRIH